MTARRWNRRMKRLGSRRALIAAATIAVGSSVAIAFAARLGAGPSTGAHRMP